MANLDSLFEEIDAYLGEDEESPDIKSTLFDVDKYLNEEEEDPTALPVKPETEQDEEKPALKGYKWSPGSTVPIIEPRYEDKPPEKISGTKYMDLVERNKAGEDIDLTKYRLRGVSGEMSDKDMEEAASEMRKSEELNRERGRKYMKEKAKAWTHQEGWFPKMHTPESSAREEDKIPGNELGFWGKLGGSMANIMAPVASRMDGTSTEEYLGKRYTMALEEGVRQYNLKQADNAIDDVYDKLYEKGEVGQPGGPKQYAMTSFGSVYAPEGKTPKKHMSKHEFRHYVKKQAAVQRRFEKDFKAGLVNEYHEPIIPEAQYKGKKPYSEYVADMYEDPDNLSNESLDNITAQSEKYFDESNAAAQKSEALDTGLNKVWSAFDGDVKESLSETEYDALMGDLSFGEEIKLLGEMLVQQPGETSKQLGIAIVEQLPAMLVTSKGLGALGKAGSMIREFSKKKQLRAVMRMRNPLVAQRFKRMKETAETKKLIARPTLKKLFAEEELIDIAMFSTAGMLYEAGKGSKYGMKEGLRDVTLGMGFSAISAPIRYGLNMSKPTMAAVNKAGKVLKFTKGMEKDPNINLMVKMHASLMDNMAFEKMQAHLSEHPGLAFKTTKDLEAENYAGAEAGKYLVKGWHDPGTGKVTYTKTWGPETIVEESSHFIYDHIKRMADQEYNTMTAAEGGLQVHGDGPYSQLLDMIQIWEQKVWNQADKMNLDVPRGGELFAQTLTAHMGHADKLDNPIVSRIDMPEELRTGLRRIWADDPVMQGKAKRSHLEVVDPDQPIRPGKNIPAEEPLRDVGDVSADMDDVIKQMGEMEAGPEKVKLKERYEDLLRERRNYSESKEIVTVKNAAAMLDELEANPSREGFEVLVKEIDEQIADPDNANIKFELTEMKKRAAAGKKKAPVTREYQQQRADLVDENDAPMFYSKLGTLIGSVVKQPMRAEQLRRTLAKKGISKEQIEWIGLDDLMKEKAKVEGKLGNIHPWEIEDLLEGHSPNLVIATRGRERNVVTNKIDEASYEVYAEDYPGDKSRTDLPYLIHYDGKDQVWKISTAEFTEAKYHKTFDDAHSHLTDRIGAETEPQFRHIEEYKTPGGDNYEEHIITMPDQVLPYKPDNQHFVEEGGGTAIAWTRTTDRSLVVDGEEGASARYIEEVQSKRHQDAADSEEGYRKQTAKSRHFVNVYDKRTRAIQRQQDVLTSEAKPGWEDKVAELDGEQHLLDDKRMWVNKGKDIENFPEVRWTENKGVWVDEDNGFLIKDVTASNRKSKPLMWDKDYEISQDGVLITHRSKLDVSKRDVQSRVTELALPYQGIEYTGSGASRADFIPEAPFKQKWSELAMKQELRLAVEDGKQWLTWSTGEEQARKWALVGKVRRINYQKFSDHNNYTYNVVGANGESIIRRVGVPAEDVKADFGPQIADEIVRGAESNTKTITPENLTLYDNQRKKGLEDFYDKGGESSLNIARVAEKFGKKYGAKVEEVEVSTGSSKIVKFNKLEEPVSMEKVTKTYSKYDNHKDNTPEQDFYWAVRNGRGLINGDGRTLANYVNSTNHPKEVAALFEKEFGMAPKYETGKPQKAWGMRINKKMANVAKKGFEFQAKKADGTVVSGRKKGKGKRLSIKGLKSIGKEEKERYVGLPPQITGTTLKEQKKNITKLANRLEKFAQEGKVAKHWYEKSSELILRIARGNKRDADLLARLIAMTSQQTGVDANFSEAIRLWYQYKDQLNKGVLPEDMKFKGGLLTEQMSAKAKRLLVGDESPTGLKINNFYRNLLMGIDETVEQGVTNDTWMARAFGYGYGQNVTEARNRFMTSVVSSIANKIGAQPHQVQAMIWTSVMDRWNKVKPRVKQKGVKEGWAVKTDRGLQVLEDKASQAAYYDAMLTAAPKLKDEINPESWSYVDSFREMEGRLAWEATPGKSTGMLKGIHEAPYETRSLLHHRVMEAMKGDDGSNIILKTVGLLEKDAHMVPGVWKGETNPSTVWEVPVPSKMYSPTGSATLDDNVANMMDQACALFGYYTKQDGVGWSYTQGAATRREGNSIKASMDRHLTRDELTQLEYGINEQFGKGAIVIMPAHDGPTFRNLTTENWWGEAVIDNVTWQNQMDEILNIVLNQDPNDNILLRASGNLLENDWKTNLNGEEYYGAIADRGGEKVFKRVDGILSSRLKKVYQDFGDEFGFPFQDETTPRGDQPGPGLGKSGTEGAVPGTEYQLKRHTEPPPDRHSGPGGQSFDLSSETTWDAFRRTFQDRFYPVKRFQKAAAKAGAPVVEDADTYLHEVVYYGRAQAAVENADEMLVSPMIKFMKDKKLTVEEVDDFLYARHAPERNRVIAERHEEIGDMQDGGSGMTNKEAGIIISNFQRDGKLESLQAVGRMVDRIHKKRLEVMEGAGLIGEDYKNNLPAYKAYVPLRGFEDPHHPLHEQGIRPGTGSKGFAMSNRERKAMGRRSKASSPLANSVSMLNTSLVDAEKNRVGQSFMKMVIDNPDWTYTNPMGGKQKLFELDPVQMVPYMDGNGQVAYRKKTHQTLAPNEFTVMQDGQQHVITISDPALANAMKQMGTNSGNMILRGLQFYNRFLAMMSTTMNPEFVLSNFTRDAQTALLHLGSERGSEVTKQVAKDVFPALAGMMANANGRRSTDPTSWNNWAVRFKNAGGKVGWFGLKNVDEMVDEMRAKLGRTGKWGKVRDGFDGVTGFLSSINEGVENSFRLSAFKNMVENGASEMEAARIAKELTVNFNRRGQAGQVANGLYLFFNASLQGISRMTQAVATNKKLQGICTGIVGAGFANGLYNYAIGGQNASGYPEYDRVPNYVGERNMVFMDPSGDGQYTKIPMPYGYNIFWNIGQAMAQLQYGAREKGDIFKDLFMASVSAFNPLGTMNSKTPMGTIMKTVTPSVGQPGLQHILNENFAGNPLKPEQAPWGPQKPEHTLYFKSVRGSSKKLAKGLSDATGGQIHKPGWLDVSPEIMDHYVNTVIGGVGHFTGNALNAVYSLYNGETPDVSKVPFLRRLRAETNDYWNTDRFRDIRDELGLMKGHERLIMKHGSDLDKKKMKFMDRAQSLQTQLSQLSKQIRDAKDRGMDPAKIKKFEDHKAKIRDRFLRDWREKIEKASLKSEKEK